MAKLGIREALSNISIGSLNMIPARIADYTNLTIKKVAHLLTQLDNP